MRATERPIAFKPWIYEIAKNACIDQFRRSRRAEEISLQADEGLAPGDYGRLVGSDPTPDAAVAAKQELDHLCGAFGGLSETHHEILVLRELEGMSYREIGERMGMSRPAVESTLFRARRRLTEEYDDLVSGARCLRIQSLIQSAASSRLGGRESRRLSRHVAHCQPCRREAMAAGLDAAILTHVPLPRRAAGKVAALLPFPIFGRGRDGGEAAVASGGSGSGWTAHLPLLSDQLSSGWAKLATAAAVLVAGVGAAGVGTEVAGSGDTPSERGGPAQERSTTTSRGDDDGGVTVTQSARGSAQGVGAERKAEGSRRSDRAGGRTDRRVADDGSGGAGAAPPAATTGSGHAGGGAADGGAGSAGGLPAVTLPAAGEDPIEPVRDTVEQVGEPVQPVVNEVTETVVEEVTETVEGATAPVQEAVGEVTGPVDEATGGNLPLP